jgi:hypothetical protein
MAPPPTIASASARYCAVDEGCSFLKKKAPKNFCSATLRSFQGHWPKMIKVFLLLFVHKKKFFLFSFFLRKFSFFAAWE